MTQPAHPLSRLSSATKPLYWFYERRLLRRIRQEPVPQHIGVIMDGNRRFAKAFGIDTKAGHKHGAGKARELLDWCLDIGIQHVTLWGFSSDNRGRSTEEVAALHDIFAQQAREMIADDRLHRHRVRVRIIGDISDFSAEAQEALRDMERATETYDNLEVNLALGYGGREEIVDAVRRVVDTEIEKGVPVGELSERITTENITGALYTAGTPDPDFVIRTSGEVRLSGFLLWQSVYSEYYFCDANWPEFRRIDFLRAIRAYQGRQRRFGK